MEWKNRTHYNHSNQNVNFYFSFWSVLPWRSHPARHLQTLSFLAALRVLQFHPENQCNAQQYNQRNKIGSDADYLMFLQMSNQNPFRFPIRRWFPFWQISDLSFPRLLLILPALIRYQIVELEETGCKVTWFWGKKKFHSFSVTKAWPLITNKIPFSESSFPESLQVFASFAVSTGPSRSMAFDSPNIF